MNAKYLSAILFFPVTVLIGVLTTRGDVLTKKISNKFVLSGISYAFIIYFIAAIICLLNIYWNVRICVSDYAVYLTLSLNKWAINFILSIFVAYFIWRFNIWGAGDAKLFICYSALIPMRQYSKVYFDYYFASFFLLLTIFIPATIFLFLKSIVYLLKRFSVGEVRNKILKLSKERLTKFNKIDICKILFGFFVFFLFFRILQQEFQKFFIKVLPNQNILILTSLLVFKPLSKTFKKKAKFIIVAFIILMGYIALEMLYSWKQFIIEIGNIFLIVMFIMILFPMLKKIMDLYAERTTQKTTPFAIWMFLGVLIIWFL